MDVGSRRSGFLRRSAFTAARVSDHRARHAVTVLTMSPNSSQQGDRGGGGVGQRTRLLSCGGRVMIAKPLKARLSCERLELKQAWLVLLLLPGRDVSDLV